MEDTASVVAHEEVDPDADYSFEYPVATCRGPGWALRGFNRDGQEWQWVWHGAHAYCDFSKQPYQWIKENKSTILSDMHDAGVKADELHMGSEHKDFKWGTTLSSKALGMLLLSVGRKKKVHTTCKGKAFNMIKDLLALCWGCVGGHLSLQPPACLPFWAKGKHQKVELKWLPGGVTQSLLDVAAQHPGMRGVWNQLFQQPWHGYSLTSGLDGASHADILVFLAWVWAHQAHQSQLWLHIGQHWLPEMVHFFGNALDTYGEELSKQGLVAMPVVLHRGVRPKNLDAVNRLLLLFRLRKKQRHRASIASTHTDVSPGELRMMTNEHYYDSIHYSKGVEEIFSGLNHLQISTFDQISWVSFFFPWQPIIWQFQNGHWLEFVFFAIPGWDPADARFESWMVDFAF